MDSSHNADAAAAPSSGSAAGGMAAQLPSQGSGHTPRPAANGDSHASSGAAANQTATVASDGAPMPAQNSEEPSSALTSSPNGHENGSSSPKPKIRIKLKMSPKRSDEGPQGKSDGTSEAGAKDEEDWLCLKCINNNDHKRIRCWNCKGWKVSQFIFLL